MDPVQAKGDRLQLSEQGDSTTSVREAMWHSR